MIRAQVLLWVDQAYFHALEAEALLRVAKSTIASRKLILDRTDALVKSNLKSELDASFARVSVEESKLLLLQADNKLSAAFAELSAALGYREPHRFTLVEEHLTRRRDVPLATLISDGLQNRPEAVGMRFRRDAALKFAASERAARFPKITLQATFGRTTTGDDRVRQTYGAAGVNVEVPLFTGGRLTARAEEANLRAQAEQKTLDEIEDRVARDVNLAWLNVNTSKKKIEVTQALLSNAIQTWELAKARYESGVASIVELSQAELGRTQAEIENATATYEFQIHRIALDYQTGTLR